MKYSEKLKHPKWQKKRLEILQRDNFTCVLCGDKETELQINHLKYTGEPYDAPNKDLETLCKHCHALKHYAKEEIHCVYKIKKDESISIIYINDLGTCAVSLTDNTFEKHHGYLFNSPTLKKMYELNNPKIEINFDGSGLKYRDFGGYLKMIKNIEDNISKQGNNFPCEVVLDRETHSMAVEIFQAIKKYGRIILTHIGGAS